MPDGPGAAAPNLTLIAALVCAVILALSAIGHVRTGTLRYELAAHGVVPARLRRLVAAAVPLTEGFLALAIVGSLWLGRSALGVAVALFASYVAYALAVLRHRPGLRTGCGCGVGEHPLGLSTAMRAAVLAVLAAAGAFGGGPSPTTDGLLISVLMSVAAVCLLVWLPVSMARPGQLAEEQHP